MAIIATTSISSLSTPWVGELSSGKHQYLTDKPERFGGNDCAPAPYDYLLASLAACTMITLRMYAEHKAIDYGHFTIALNFHLSSAGEERITRVLHFDQTFDAATEAKILQICQKTPVTKTLLRGTIIETSIFN